ncbi:hypothetical protein E3O82_002404 [Enterococcus faecalis]|nr:hypothetical protein [Enterococcus faecalis]
MEMNQDLLIAISVIAITLVFTLVLFTFFLKYLANKRENLLDKEIAIYNEQLKRENNTIKKKYEILLSKKQSEQKEIQKYQAEISSIKKELADLKSKHITNSQISGTTFEHSKIYLKRDFSSLSQEIYANFLVNLNARMLDMPKTILEEIDILFHEMLIRKCYQFPEILDITKKWCESDQLLIEEDLKQIKAVLALPEMIRSLRYLENEDEYIRLILYALNNVTIQQETLELLIYMCNTYKLTELLDFTNACIDIIQCLTSEHIVEVQVSNPEIEAEFFKCIKRMRYEKYLVFSVSQSKIKDGISANYQGKVIATSLFTLLDDYMNDLERIY